MSSQFLGVRNPRAVCPRGSRPSSLTGLQSSTAYGPDQGWRYHFQDGSLHGCWREASAPCRVDLFPGLLEWPHNMTTNFSWSERFKAEKEESHTCLFMNQPQELHSPFSHGLSVGSDNHPQREGCLEGRRIKELTDMF